MTVRDMLNTLDHEVNVVVSPLALGSADIYVWSADWIGGSGWPEELEKYLDCETDDIYVELRDDPEKEYYHPVPMLVLPVEEEEGDDAEKRE